MIEKEGAIQKRAAKVLEKIARYKERKAEETRQKFSSVEVKRAEQWFQKYLMIKSIAEARRTIEIKPTSGGSEVIINKDYYVDPLVYDYRPVVSSKQASVEDLMEKAAKHLAWIGFEDLVSRR